MAKKKSSKNKVTPLMKQYFDVKSKYPDAILLFRVGDFYETFGEDAVNAAAVLGIVLTSRNNGGSDIELAGFPHHSVDVYLPRLVKAGYRVAICEQLEKPSKDKKIVRRGVTEMVTPGLAMSEQLLDHRQNNFLCALYRYARGQWGICLLDISTGEFLVASGDEQYMQQLVQSFQPSEFLFARSQKEVFFEKFGKDHYVFVLDDWAFAEQNNEEKLLRHFKIKNLKGFGIHDMPAVIISAGAILNYLDTTENRNIEHISSIRKIVRDQYVWLDEFTLSNLELLEAQHTSGQSLYQMMDRTLSPMGSRLLKKWISLPLIELDRIERRHGMVGELIEDQKLREDLSQSLKKTGDVERMVSKVSMRKINPREMAQLKNALIEIGKVKYRLLEEEQKYISAVAEKVVTCERLVERIEQSLIEEPPTNLNKGGVIQYGCHDDLDEYRDLIANSKERLLALQDKEAAATGIDKLKVGFNNVFGYYFEVTNKYKDKGLVPEHWVRKQTLTNSERYISEELKVLEEKILTAEEKILVLEERLFEELVSYAQDYIKPIQLNAQLIAQLDCIYCFAILAEQYNYVRPEMKEGRQLIIKQGRHPVIEALLPPGESYVPNDLYLSSEDQQIIMITGPNMSGKSAVLRQTALICILAQMGSFVPAESAELGYIDKVFTRVGASDNISSGESTFMVEMNETANIMNNLSPRSLILLDEIGRGTSTYDGISIAWAIAEF
ncbi:MAG TPA: DNA mismatch repair protein MutS, partial [Saprospiraceae bacterium]|nr:DNA mismatch repair protein MutS [Saprospiraceae bacterium]